MFLLVLGLSAVAAVAESAATSSSVALIETGEIGAALATGNAALGNGVSKAVGSVAITAGVEGDVAKALATIAGCSTTTGLNVVALEVCRYLACYDKRECVLGSC